ncbi:hypothetical protein FNH22_30560 [Fulvivirga sp. M361]|uniref:Tc toxin subunit A-related protein n=1 Tax=Fulvivirga sp. M361 TaxID=2594266 RepID=UPI00117AB880|nr:hypothetical protein [Fulvivirga sp. M361]TRX47103.1 hypothetical protein FNH22_30560 [Fulvivirga sp. M361]
MARLRQQLYARHKSFESTDYQYRVKKVVYKGIGRLIRVAVPVYSRRYPRRGYRPLVNYRKYKFYSFYHSHVCTMIRQLNRYGIDGLLDPAPDTENGPVLLRQAGSNQFSFTNTYKPVSNIVDTNYPEEGFDFDFDSPYGIYNWELFFHGPLTIAARLSQNQKFEEAQKWFHYIFNPTETDGLAPERYWKVKPFFKHNEENNIATVLNKMKSGDQAFNRQLNQWMKDPFQPHVIARLRTVAYMKTVVMKYVDNLIHWGDHLFRRDTIETINEATQLYILAAQILGPKPAGIEKPNITPRTVKDVLDNANSFSNAHVKIEDEIGPINTGDEEEASTELNSLNSILYFCTAPNDKLLGYWDTVADRLFKIRNCQNIEGITRSLALFEPPIDPALLVRASAAGLDIGQVLNTISGASLPHYRFRVLIQKAVELCNDVKSLGGALLSALEKRDAEELSQLRSGQEVTLLKAVRQVRQRAIQESEENIASLENAKELTEIRREFYGSREYMNEQEKGQLKHMARSVSFQNAASAMALLGAALSLIPRVNLGISGAFGSPVATIDGVDGKSLGASLNAVHSSLNFLAQIENQAATKAGIKGGYDRRRDDWELQTSLAEKELEQIDKQITAARIRLAVAERELQNHDLQTEQAEEIAAYMKDKYTNKDLYNWMVTQISGLYFQSYQLAYEVSRMAEQAFQFELAQEDTFFVEFGHWDSLRKGLLSGEKLQRDIRRMEIAYLEQNKREYELTRHISLSMLAPDQLINLRENGACDINIPEVLFDLDHPGQYLRRIKSVRLSIPAVTGPYTNVNARLTLLSNRYRKTARAGSSYAYTGIDDQRFRHNVTGIQSIATSSGQNDAGLFELNFQDERYLPFEGVGAISSWRLELSSEYRQFDYDTISDVVMHMSYMSREGGESLKTAANTNINAGLNKFADELAMSDTGLTRLFSMKTNFPNQLHQLLQPIAGEVYQETTVPIKQEHFPHFLSNKTLTILGDVTLLVKLKDSSTVIPTELSPTVKTVAFGNLLPADVNTPLPYKTGTVLGNLIDNWPIRMDATNLETKFNSDEVEDVYLIVNYTVI